MRFVVYWSVWLIWFIVSNRWFVVVISRILCLFCLIYYFLFTVHVLEYLQIWNIIKRWISSMSYWMLSNIHKWGIFLKFILIILFSLYKTAWILKYPINLILLNIESRFFHLVFFMIIDILFLSIFYTTYITDII